MNLMFDFGIDRSCIILQSIYRDEGIDLADLVMTNTKKGTQVLINYIGLIYF